MKGLQTPCPAFARTQLAAPSWAARCIQSPRLLRWHSPLRSGQAGGFKQPGGFPSGPHHCTTTHGGEERHLSRRQSELRTASASSHGNPICSSSYNTSHTHKEPLEARGDTGAARNPASGRVLSPQSGEWKVQRLGVAQAVGCAHVSSLWLAAAPAIGASPRPWPPSSSSELSCLRSGWRRL